MNLKNTNVTSKKFGRGASVDIAATLGGFVVSTMEVPWRIAKPLIGGKPLEVHMVDSMEFTDVEAQIASLPRLRSRRCDRRRASD